MKVSMHCAACSKVHKVDLREINESFTCDACGNMGQALELTEIESYEKQILLSGKMGVLAAVFTFATLASLWLYFVVYDHDSRPGQFHETVFWVFAGCLFLTFIFAIVSSINNKRVEF